VSIAVPFRIPGLKHVPVPTVTQLYGKYAPFITAVVKVLRLVAH
jgi:hypothetical protein